MPRVAPTLPNTVDRREFLALYTAVMLPMFLAAVDQTLLATATPRIVAELGGFTDSAWIALGYLIAATVMIPLYGRWGDAFGRRRMLAIAIGVFSLGSVLGGLAPGMGSLVAARVLQGLGGGGLMVSSQALIGEVVPPRERARFQGYFAAVFTVSSVTGPVLGGYVVAHAHWRWLFWLNLPLCAVALWRLWTLDRRLRARQGEQPVAGRRAADRRGVMLFGLGTVLSLVWVTFAGHRFAWTSAPSLGLLAVAVVCWVLLTRHERRAVSPFLPVELLAIPGIRPIAVTVMLVASALFALIFYLPIYLQLGHGTAVARSGLLLLPVTLGLVSGSAATGRVIAHRAVAGELPRLGLSVSALALASLALVPPHPALLVGIGYLCGLGFGTVMPNAQILIQTLAGRPRLGAAAALVSLSRSAGATLGAGVFGALAFALVALTLGDANLNLRAAALDGPSEPVARAFRAAWGALAAVVAVAAWVASRLPRLDISDTPGSAPVSG